MRSFLAFATIFLVATSAFAASDDTLDRLNKIATTKFGKTILETIQVELQTKDDPRPVIIRLLEELINETETSQKNHDLRIKFTREEQAKIQANLKSEIEMLTNRIASNKAALGKAEKALDDAEEAEKAKIAAIEEFQRQLDAAREQRERERAAFEKKDAKYDKLIAVLGEVRRIIYDRIQNRDSKKVASFLEKKANTQLVNALAEIKESMNAESFAQVSEGYSSMISFIATKAQALLAPEQAEKNAVSGLQSVVDLCDRLINKFRNEKEEAIRIEDQRRREYERKRELLSNQQANARIELAEIRRTISTLKAQIATLKEQIEEDTKSLGEAQSNLSASIKLLAEAEEEYSRLTKQRTWELKCLREVHEIVVTRLTNLRANVEQAIINSGIKA